MMMYVPGIFGENLMDDWFDGFEDAVFGKRTPAYRKSASGLMKTDVKELEDGYEVEVELPGYQKEDLSLDLSDGYLTIKAAKTVDETEEKEGKVIRRERYSGSMSRSFYVGDTVTEEDIKAKYENGILSLNIPKIDPSKKIPEKKTIAIAG